MAAIAERVVSRSAAMKERILETTERLFYQEGIRATGVDTIADEAGISKRTLYNHFPSKDALIAAYLQRGFFEQRRSGYSAADQILRVFDRLEKVFAHEDFRGCRFINAVAELGDSAGPARDIAIDFKERRRLWFHDMLVEAGARGADTLATQLALLRDGAITAAMVSGDPAVARAAAGAARILLAEAGVATTPAAAKPGPAR